MIKSVKSVRINPDRNIVIIEREINGNLVRKGFCGKENVNDWLVNATLMGIDLIFINELPKDCTRLN